MLSLTDFLATLPGILPRNARRVILEGDLLPQALKDDILMRNASLIDTVLIVGPDAAAAILAAYRDGYLPMQRGKVPVATPLADAYLERAPELRAEVAERKRREAAIKDPSLIRESDLVDEDLIDQVFIAAMGLKAGTLSLGGVSVTKSLRSYPSNSGKSTGWGVTFSWTGSDGVQRSSGRTPPEADNRRNDEDRNWGLGPGGF